MEFKDVLTEMENIYASKNADYGDSFKLSLDEHGLIASIVRMEDKLNRLKTLVKNKQEVKDESIADTLLDLANYSAMTYMWINKFEPTNMGIANQDCVNVVPKFIQTHLF